MPLWLWLQSHYATLGIDPTATPEEIKKAYRSRSREHHPDRNPDRPAFAEWWFKQVQSAWQVLSDPMSRDEHDRDLAARLEKRSASDRSVSVVQPARVGWPSADDAMRAALVDVAFQLGKLFIFSRFK